MHESLDKALELGSMQISHTLDKHAVEMTGTQHCSRPRRLLPIDDLRL